MRSWLFASEGGATRTAISGRWVHALLFLVVTIGLLAYSANSVFADAKCGDEVTLKDGEIQGTACDDVIVAPEGVDSILAGGGDDVIVGNPDVALIVAGAGNDVIYASYATATVEDQQNLDAPDPILELSDRRKKPSRLTGRSSSPDYIPAEDGDQTIRAGDGADRVWGGRGNDKLYGENGDDLLFGSVGDDYLIGGPGNDRLSGGNGSDNILGEDGNDFIHGDTVGDVRKSPGSPSEGLSGGGGTDTLSFATAISPGFNETRSPYTTPSPSFLTSHFSGFPGDNNHGVYVDLSGRLNGRPTADNGKNSEGGGTDYLVDDFEIIVGSPLSDVIIGTDQGNWIFGGGGADIIVGNGGTDFIFGEQDGDYIDGDNADATTDGVVDYLNGGGPGPDPSQPTYYQYNWDQCSLLTGRSTQEDSQTGCEFITELPRGVQPPPSNKINVGIMANAADPTLVSRSVYVTGSSGADNITAKFDWNGLGSVSFIRTSTSPEFNIPNAVADGCTSPSVLIVTCPMGSGSTHAYWMAPTLTMTGGPGGDSLDTHIRSDGVTTANFPETTLKVLQGDDGGDVIQGDAGTEDTLIDGKGGDWVFGYGGSDSVYSTETDPAVAIDVTYGGDDGDVLYVTRTCQNKSLYGGGGEDNVTWAAWTPGGENNLPNWSETPGIFASLLDGTVGRPGGSTPSCGSSTTNLDELYGIENLEGSGGKDVIKGDALNNVLLGRGGADQIYGGDGVDYIHANSGDHDEKLYCGLGNDQLAKDFQRGDLRDTGADVLNGDDCERAKFYEDRSVNPPLTPIPYEGMFPEYDLPVDVAVLAAEDPYAMYRLGEKSNDYAFDEYTEPDKSSGSLAHVGEYFGEADTFRSSSTIDDTPDFAHSFDGDNDFLKLSTSDSAKKFSTTSVADLDPASSTSGGFTVELWSRFLRSASSSDVEYLISKMDTENGFSLSRGVNDNDEDGLSEPTVTGSVLIDESMLRVAVDDPGVSGWHHYALVLGGSSVYLYLDGTLVDSASNGNASVIATSPANAAAMVGAKGPNQGFIQADLDSLTFFRHALNSCEVGRHWKIKDPGVRPGRC